jgi:hypothetical protein
LIYVRSRRPLLLAAGAAVALTFAFAIIGWFAWDMIGGRIAAIVLWAGSLGALGVAGWAGVSLHGWPPCKLAFFRDRLVVVSERHEMRALWDQIQAVTLAEVASWPNVQITDSVTLTFRAEAPMRFKPKDFGLDPAGCRDLLARLRDEPELRERLPEFDSERDLEVRPLVAGEAIEPKF